MLSPFQFFSKTWIGNANLLLKRGQRLKPLTAESVKTILEELKPDLCIFSGDFTTTSQPKEFEKATNFIKKLESLNIPLLKIPGNHDHYTKKAYAKKLFYNYLSNNAPGKFSTFTLKNDGFEIYLLEDATVILLDQTKATPWFTAYGHMSQKVSEQIKEALSSVAQIKPFIFVGHFPLIKSQDGRFHHSLKGSNHLIELLQTFSPSFYLHGHNHNLCITQKHGFTQVDSGSLSDVQKGSFIVLDTQNSKIIPYMRKGDEFIQGSTSS